jgi:hypothetical protein
MQISTQAVLIDFMEMSQPAPANHYQVRIVNNEGKKKQQ